MFTENNDVFYMQGTLQQLTMTLTNPYTGFSIDIDEEMNVNTGIYDALGGRDLMRGSDYGDALFLEVNDPITGVLTSVIKNVETINGGAGGDIIILASKEILLGDIRVSGSYGNDIIWTNIGNDSLESWDGDDILDGGPGNDRLSGQGDNDQLFGGEGDDTLYGGDGDDILYGGTDLGLIEVDKAFSDDVTFPELMSGMNISNLIPPGTPALGINSDNLSVSYETTATLTFQHGVAGYNNTLGMYAIREDGTIETASILWENVKTAGFGVEHAIDLPVGAGGGQFGFFIIANGDRVNNGYDGMDNILGDGVINLVYDYGGVNERAAKIDDDGNMVSIIYDDGTVVQELSGYHYHTTPRGETPNLNWDGETHAVSGLLGPSNQDVLRIGFEDLPRLGDADYEDVLFDLDIDRAHIDASEVGNDYLDGGAGNDLMYGEAGDDFFYMGEGFDQVYGGSGADTFLYRIQDDFYRDLPYEDPFADKIYDFNAAEGDVLDINYILVGYDPLTDVVSDFIKFVDNGGDTEVHVNFDGDVGGTFAAIAVFDGGISDTVTDLINNGNLILD